MGTTKPTTPVTTTLSTTPITTTTPKTTDKPTTIPSTPSIPKSTTPETTTTLTTVPTTPSATTMPTTPKTTTLYTTPITTTTPKTTTMQTTPKTTTLSTTPTTSFEPTTIPSTPSPTMSTTPVTTTLSTTPITTTTPKTTTMSTTPETTTSATTPMNSTDATSDPSTPPTTTLSTTPVTTTPKITTIPPTQTTKSTTTPTPSTSTNTTTTLYTKPTYTTAASHHREDILTILIGGCDHKISVTEINSYHPNGISAELPSSPFNTCARPMGVFYGHHIVVCGGGFEGEGTPCFKTGLTNPEWKPFAPMIEHRERFTMNVIGDKIVVIGGFKAGCDIEVFNGEVWEEGPPLNVMHGVVHHCSVSYQKNKVMVIGGLVDGSTTDLVQTIDILTGKFPLLQASTLTDIPMSVPKLSGTWRNIFLLQVDLKIIESAIQLSI